jgi:signal transduction histidine kinase
LGLDDLKFQLLARLNHTETAMKNFLFLIAIIFIAGLANPEPANAQTANALRSSPSALSPPPNELGKPFLTNWLPKDYGANAQNWAIAQDDRGVMYFGNSDGVLEFDGVSWRLHKFGSVSFTRSLAIADDGKLYIGGKGEFGCFAPVHEAATDGKAKNPFQRQFVSLLKYLHSEDREFTDVWNIAVSSQGVFFRAEQRLFRYVPPPYAAQPQTAASPVGRAEASPREGRMHVWKPKTTFGGVAAVDDRIYVAQSGIGLMQVKGDSLELAPGGEKIGGSLEFMAPFSDRDGREKILIGTSHGLFWYDGANCEPLAAAAASFFKELEIYTGAVLSDGAAAVATNGGVVIVDPAGNGSVRHVLDKSSGLKDDIVINLFCDRQGGLWLALNNGIARVEAPAPLTFYDETRGLRGSGNAIIRHQNTLYVATDVGVFYLHASPEIFPKIAPDDGSGTINIRQPEFRPVAGIKNWNWAFLIVPETGELLAGNEDGLYRIRGAQAEFLTTFGHSIVSLHHSSRDRNRVYVGLRYGGLAAARYVPDSKGGAGSWVNEGKITGIDGYIRNITESADGSLWLTAKYENDLIRVVFPPSPSSSERKDLLKPEIQRFGAAQGLPEDNTIYTVVIVGQLYAYPNGSVFRFDAQRGMFIPDSSIHANPDTSTYIEKMVEDKWGNVWFDFDETLRVARRVKDGGYTKEAVPFRRIERQPFYTIYPEENGVAWFAGADGLIRYDGRVTKNYGADFPALIRRVIAGGDSLIFDGLPVTNAKAEPSLSFARNALRFECAAPSYDNLAANEYQYFLEGFDKGWSSWTKETKKDYTNLPPGRHRFRVRAKNIYEHLSREGVYEFAILPPWWRTWWAYGGYALLLGLLVFAVDRVQRRRLIKKEREAAEIRETQLRAQAVEAENKALQAENERKKNVELLSEIGKEITASLDMDTIFYRLYERVNQLADASSFGVGIYHPEKAQIEYRLAIEKGKRYAPYTRDTRDKNQFPVWCIENRQPVFMNDVTKEYSRYISEFKSTNVEGMMLEDGTLPEEPFSIIYLPLISQDKVLGVITIQSFQKNAYTDYHLNLLQNLAAYTAIALDNAEAYRQVDASVQQLNATLENLKATQQQLITQQKLASLGQLTAGIAHEIKNPLNFVNNFAVLSMDLAKELREELEKRKAKSEGRDDFENIEEILDALVQNAEKINHHGKRADGIVKSMMQHARGSSGQRELADINHLLDEAMNLTYHGMRANDASFNITIEKEYDESIGQLEVVPQDLSRVFLNILNNAAYAAHQKKKAARDNFSPTLSLSTKNLNSKIEIRIRDNGDGIPPDIREKIFNPFFTTKPTGQGTGLGLSISYDIIVQQHRGEIKVETEEGKFTEFAVRSPLGV